MSKNGGKSANRCLSATENFVFISGKIAGAASFALRASAANLLTRLRLASHSLGEGWWSLTGSNR
jgi:hypothetical protein